MEDVTARRAPGRPAGILPRDPAPAVAAVTVLATAAVVAVALGGGAASPAIQVVLFVAILGTTAAAWWTPLVAGACCLVGYAAYGLATLPDIGVALPVVLSLFVVGMRGGRRALLRLGPLALAVGALLGLRSTTDPAGFTSAQVTAATVLAVFVAAPLVAGVTVGRLRDDAAGLRERAQRLARLAELERAAGVAQERSRIARELHDIVAHRLSAITVQAHAGEHLAAVDPDAAGRAFGAVAQQARHGLAEMHGLLEVLRDPPEEVAVHRPGLRDLPDLLATERSTGIEVGWHGPDGVTGADDEVGLTAYRVVQESLSNARRHAAGAPVSVELATGARELVVTVVNGPAGTAREAPGVGTGGGFGLLGMRERVELCGGTLEAGPRPDGGWQVRARLPVPRPAPQATAARAGRS